MKKIYIPLVILALVLIVVIAERFWSHDISHKTAKVSTQQGLFEVHHWQDNGATIAFIPLEGLPIVDISILFPAGSAYDKDKSGLAYLTAQMIGESTKTQDAQSIHEAFENVGAAFSASASRDYASLTVRTLSENKALNPSVAMLQDVLSNTVFQQDVFARERNRLLAAIKMREQSASSVVSENFFKEAYGEHPYAQPVMGYEESVQSLTTKDLENFYANYYARNHAVIIIAGDVSLRQAQNIASDLLANLPDSDVDIEIPLVATTKAKTDHVKFPSTQTHIMLGLPAMAKGNPDFFAFNVGNHILGGNSLVSQLFDVVREQQGLAYNVASHIITLKQPGPFIIYLQTRGKEAKKALSLVEQTVEQYIKNGPTEEELKNAKTNINGRFALGLGSNAAIADHIALLAFYNLPWDYYEQYQDNINAVTIEDIQTVFKKYLIVTDFVQVSVGEHAP